MCNTKTHINIGMRNELNISVVEASLVEASYTGCNDRGEQLLITVSCILHPMLHR